MRSGEIGRIRDRPKHMFSKRFGELVRNYQNRHGLTNTDVALKVFGKETASTQVSDLKSGRHVPTAETIANARDGLGIPQSEIDKCYEPSDLGIPDWLKDEFKLARNLLESLALRFQHTNPDAPSHELEQFLKDKASEYRALQDRLSALEKHQKEVKKYVSEAMSYIADGNFEEADTLLATAEETQQVEQTLKAIRKQSEIRTARAYSALLKNDPEETRRHYSKAANFFSEFSKDEAAAVRVSGASKMREHGVSKDGSFIWLSIDLLSETLSGERSEVSKDNYLDTLNLLGSALQELAERDAGQKKAQLAQRAVRAFLEAIEINGSKDIVYAMFQNNLGNAYWSLGDALDVESKAEVLAHAIQAYEEALKIKSFSIDRFRWAMTMHNCAIAIEELGWIDKSGNGVNRLKDACNVYLQALTVRTQEKFPYYWAMTLDCLGGALHRTALRESGVQVQQNLVSALKCHTEAQKGWTKSDFTNEWATAELNKGWTLEAMSEHCDPAEVRNLLLFSLESYENARSVFEKTNSRTYLARAKSSCLDVKAALEKM